MGYPPYKGKLCKRCKQAPRSSRLSHYCHPCKLLNFRDRCAAFHRKRQAAHKPMRESLRKKLAYQDQQQQLKEAYEQRRKPFD